jgi:hypothetical protein
VRNLSASRGTGRSRRSPPSTTSAATKSTLKSLLSSVVGLAYDGGMIRSVDDPARDSMAPIQLYSPVPAGNRAERMGTGDLIDLFGTPHKSFRSVAFLVASQGALEGVASPRSHRLHQWRERRLLHP